MPPVNWLVARAVSSAAVNPWPGICHGWEGKRCVPYDILYFGQFYVDRTVVFTVVSVAIGHINAGRKSWPATTAWNWCDQTYSWAEATARTRRDSGSCVALILDGLLGY